MSERDRARNRKRLGETERMPERNWKKQRDRDREGEQNIETKHRVL